MVFCDIPGFEFHLLFCCCFNKLKSQLMYNDEATHILTVYFMLINDIMANGFATVILRVLIF